MKHKFVFPCTLFEFLRRFQANKLWCNTQNWPSYDAQVERSPHDQFGRRNMQPSASKCFFHEQLLFDLAHLRRPKRRTVINLFWRTAIIFFHISLHQSTQTFFKRLSNCAGSNENKSYLRPGECSMLNVCRRKKFLKMPLSHGMSHDDLTLSVHARHQCSLTQYLFLNDLHGPRLLTTVVDNSIH